SAEGHIIVIGEDRFQVRVGGQHICRNRQALVSRPVSAVFRHLLPSWIGRGRIRESFGSIDGGEVPRLSHDDGVFTTARVSLGEPRSYTGPTCMVVSV